MGSIISNPLETAKQAGHDFSTGNYKGAFKNSFATVNPIAGTVMNIGDKIGEAANKLGDLDPTKVGSANTSDITNTAAQVGGQSRSGFNSYMQGQMGVQPPSVTAQTIAGNMQNVAAPQIGNGMTDESRGLQMTNLQRLDAAASGAAPSAAQMQMQAGQDQALASQMAAANSGHGGFNPGAVRQAQVIGAGMQQQTNQQSAMLRANEMANARQAYGEAAGQLRGADMSMATNQAQMGMQAGIANQNVNLAARTSDQGAHLQAEQANAANQLQNRNMMDQMQNQYMQSGMTAEMARQKGATDIASMEADRQKAIAEARSKAFSSITGGVGALGAAALAA